MAIRQAESGVVDYEGAVLAEYENNGYDDSDFYAIVYEAATDSVKHVIVGTTRAPGWCSCQIDATEEVKVKARQVMHREIVALLKIKMKFEAEKVATDKTVKVVRGKKIPIGTTAVVKWFGKTQFGARVGLKINGKVEFTSATNVEVIDPDQYVDPSTVEADADQTITNNTTGKHASWRYWLA